MKKRGSGFGRRLALTLIVFAVIFTGGFLLVNRVSNVSGHAETDMVRDAIRSAMLTCYAVEGAYPASLDYLEEHYGLAYNKEIYQVSYSAFATNIMPSVQVMVVGGVAP